ncbi:hypothetical protein A9235_07110 [Polynucleobacter sp. MWH-Tro8-2-5-gr]|uniref:hypothetical protein n=1 Tax=Polynucleobacter sp. MWH-Tro8-2-5-gr TaxID=1855606 RepID=UPI0008F8A2C4|nr:hypothetical protein [Polynucleobacter sp. MWH-Tro8-2-5-gr]OIM98631.1 hypothetical protein A9235_07110 [Polynucleobacter sp. MWH-Tro8-2-5-gr]
MFDKPIFSLPLDSKIAGDDPLGLAPTNERLYGAVFPGINNVVRYIRVYSALCWISQRVDRYLKLHGATLSNKEVKNLFDQASQKMELLIGWTNQHKGYRAVAGALRNFPTDNKPVKLIFESFGNSRVSLLDAVAYRPSITNGLRFLEQRTNATFGCTPAGELLANAFNSHIESSTHYEWIANILKLNISRSDVLEIEPFLDLGIPSHSEQSAFLQQFFPNLGEGRLDDFTQNRWLSIHLVLQSIHADTIYKQSIGKAGWTTEDEIRIAMARGRTPDGTLLNLSGLETVQAWWAILQLRQLQRLALDTLFAMVERFLDSKTIAQETTSIDKCAQQLGDLLTPELISEYELNVVSLFNTFHESRDACDSLYATACSKSDDPDEFFDLFHHIQELRSGSLNIGDPEDNDALASAYIALIFCAAETDNLLNLQKTKDALETDRDSCSLLSLLALVKQMGNTTPSAFLSYVLKHWVILRHFQIVADRSRQNDGKNRFRFMVGDNGLERFDPAAGMSQPAFSQDRLQHILILSEQSGLLESKEGGYCLTKLGANRMAELGNNTAPSSI